MNATDKRANDTRRLYGRLNETVRYASGSNLNGDVEGERIALGHAVELIVDILGWCYEDWEGDDGEDAVELDGMREVPRKVQDLQETGAAQEEGSPEAHVVPVVQDGDEASGEVLKPSVRCCMACGHSHEEEHAEGQLVYWLDPSCGRAVKGWEVCPRFDSKHKDE